VHVEPDFTEDVLSSRLAPLPPSVLAQVPDYALRALDLERERGASIDARASTLLGAVGLASSLVLVFGVNAFIQQKTAFQALGRRPWVLVQFVFVGALVCGVISGAVAIAALLDPRLPPTFRNARLLDPELLQQVTRSRDATTTYDRAVVTDVLLSLQHLTREHDKKMRRMTISQLTLGGFVLWICPLGTLMYALAGP
jgi:hypothetical protein